jgi:4-aminobutyrate--pyruvate transaminase
VACAVAIETLKIYEERNILGQVRRAGPALQKGLRALSGHPLIGEVRGVGLVAGVELVRDKATKEPFDPGDGVGAFCGGRAQEHGLIVRPLGDSIAFSPPLVITEAEIGDMIARFTMALDDTEAMVTERGLR